ncbi:MAG: DinB family protein [Gemmatimonadaceae bacterium]
MTFDAGARFLERSRYYLGLEYPAKLRSAVLAVPADKLWWRPHPSCNSVGNLVLHLAGNVRQWVVSGIGGAPDVRHRDAEFAADGGMDAAELLEHLEKALSEVDAVLARLAPETLGEVRRIQGRETTIQSALYHVVEHFSGHVGQVILLAKMFAPGEIRFYDDTGGLARPTFLGDGRTDVQ